MAKVLRKLDNLNNIKTKHYFIEIDVNNVHIEMKTMVSLQGSLKDRQCYSYMLKPFHYAVHQLHSDWDADSSSAVPPNAPVR